MDDEYAAQVGLGDELSPFVRMQFREFAETYAAIPLLSVVRCLVEVDREANQIAGPDERGEVAAHLARERLDELNARYQQT